MVLAAVGAGAPAATEAILPPRTTIEPRSITWPLPTTIRAFVIVRSWAASGATPASERGPAAIAAARAARRHFEFHDSPVIFVRWPLRHAAEDTRKLAPKRTRRSQARPSDGTASFRVRGGCVREPRACRESILRSTSTPSPEDSAPLHGGDPSATSREDVRLRTVWLSDVHLGSRECRVNLLLDFLRQRAARCSISSATSSTSRTCAASSTGPRATPRCCGCS